MLNEIRQLNGLPGTTHPGKTGADGHRGNVMFMDSSVGTYKICFDTDRKYIKSQFSNDVLPIKNDYILYTDGGYKYIYIITGYNTLDSRYEVSLLDSWESNDKVLSDQYNYDTFSIYINTQRITYSINDSEYGTVSIDSSIEKDKYPAYFSDKTNSADVITFNIVSENSYLSGNKITVEFNTENTSAGMYGMKALIQDCNNSNNNVIHGSLERYRKEVVKFDNEKLDNFEITLKDWNDGVGDANYIGNIYLPKDAVNPITKYGNYYNETNIDGSKIEKSSSYPYRCNVYMYTKDDDNNVIKENIGTFDLDSLTYQNDTNAKASIPTPESEEPSVEPIVVYKKLTIKLNNVPDYMRNRVKYDCTIDGNISKDNIPNGNEIELEFASSITTCNVRIDNENDKYPTYSYFLVSDYKYDNADNNKIEFYTPVREKDITGYANVLYTIDFDKCIKYRGGLPIGNNCGKCQNYCQLYKTNAIQYVYNGSSTNTQERYGYFKINSDCVNCGLCTKSVCPAGAIALKPR